MRTEEGLGLSEASGAQIPVGSQKVSSCCSRSSRGYLQDGISYCVTVIPDS